MELLVTLQHGELIHEHAARPIRGSGSPGGARNGPEDGRHKTAIRSVMVQSLHYLLVQTDDRDVWSDVEFSSGSHRMRPVGHPLAIVHV
jgi:hypothetical protein